MTNSPSFDRDKKQHLEIARSPEPPVKRDTSTELHTLPTTGQLMRSASQAIERVYRENIDHRPTSVKSTLFSEKVMIWVEGSMTPLESLLFEQDIEKAQLLRTALDKLMRPFFVDALAKALNTNVLTLILETSYTSNCTGIIAQLTQPPTVRLSTRKGPTKKQFSS